MGKENYFNIVNIETFTSKEGIQKILCICSLINNKEFFNYVNLLDKKDVFFSFLENILINSENDIKKYSIFIHNLSFDGTFIIKSLTENNIKFEVFIRENSIYFISFYYMENFFEFKCSYKILPFSLKEYSSFFNEKIKIKTFPHLFSLEKNINYIGDYPEERFFTSKKDYIEFKENKEFKNTYFSFKEEILSYCFNKIYITKDLIQNFYSIINKNFRKYLINSYSLPSFSYKIFFKKFNNFKINHSLSKQDYVYLKDSYFGGRCEVFGNPYFDEKTFYYDFPGMYSLCMLEKFPLGEGKYHSEPSLDFLSKIGFHYIKFYSDSHIPVLPVKINNKLLFPNGKWEGIYWYEEIKEFIKHGGKVEKIYSSYIYDSEDYVFKEFIDYFFKFREKGYLYKKLSKNIINSLYGSFALKEEDCFYHITFSEYEAESIRFNFNTEDSFKIGLCYFTKVIKDAKSNKVFNKKSLKWSNFRTIRNISYSSIIASKARVKLYSFMKDVERDGGRVLYCDTDSVFASYPNFKRINKIGDVEWSNEFEDSFFISSKFYGYKENGKEFLKVKGINLDNDFNNLNYDLIKNLFLNNIEKISFENQLNFYKKGFDIYVEKLKKDVFLNKYEKRKFSLDKKTTQAIRND